MERPEERQTREDWRGVLDSDEENEGEMSWRDFIATLQEAYESIPEELRESVTVRVSGYEEAGVYLKYLRPETNEEIQQRLHNMDEQRRIRENHERERRVKEQRSADGPA